MDSCNTSANTNTEKCATEGIDIQCYLILNNSTQKIFIAVLCIITGTVCILENCLVLSMIFSSAHLKRKPSFLFIGSLASADLLASLIFSYSFVDFHVFHGAGTPSVFLFKLGGVILSFTASLGSLLLTAFDRYICIHQPSRYKAIVTQKRALQALTVMWIGTTIISYLPLMGLNCCHSDSVCSELFPLIDNKYLGSWILLHTVDMEKHNVQAERGQRRMRMDVMLAKTLAIVLTVLVVCWTPSLILMTYSLFFPLDSKIKAVFAFISTLCLVNSMVNPIIYALKSRELRRRLLRHLKKVKCLKKLIKKPQDVEGTPQNLEFENTYDDTICDTEFSM
uniref:G-protein coupled receptors family 1 profile domain-containing protein n=1 Tax=Pyxicephalus adspersus TaxID=30357 RepID=A0AAV3AQE9_PYXAD|nr:TPA: hypothetical protein GDO54_001269 [Pyxicephalus adspersus]